MDLDYEDAPILSAISLDFLDEDDDGKVQDDGKIQDERENISENCFDTDRHLNFGNLNLGPPFDPANSQKFRHQLSANSFRNWDISQKPAVGCYPRSPSAVFEAYLSTLATDLQGSRRRRLRSLPSSYGSSRSPLSCIDNLEILPSRHLPSLKPTTTQAKSTFVGEDVLVMDGVLVEAKRVPLGSNRPMERPTPLDCTGMTGCSSLYKTEICHPWIDTGTCRHGSKCQFAHGKEEICPDPAPSAKLKPEICKSFGAIGAKTCRFFSHAGAAKPPSTNMVALAPDASKAIRGTSTEAEEMAALALGVSTSDAEAYINGALYGQSSRWSRLPAFRNICAESE